MKFILEFAKFKDILKTTNNEIKRLIDQNFQKEENLIDNIFI